MVSSYFQPPQLVQINSIPIHKLHLRAIPSRFLTSFSHRFYVNVYTKKSQWEKPTTPVFPIEDEAPQGAPPGYEHGSQVSVTDTKKNPYENPYDARSTGASDAGPSKQQQEDEDARFAAKLQAEEDARAHGGSNRSAMGGAEPPPGYGYGEANSYSQGGGTSPYPPAQSNSPYAPPQNHSPYPNSQQQPLQQQQYGSDPFPQNLPPRDKGKSAGGGFIGKLLGKATAGKPQGSSGYGGYPQQPSYGGYPGANNNYGGAPGGYGGGGFGGGYGGGSSGYHKAPKKSGMGMGAMGLAGGAALGLGAGVAGGVLAHEYMEHEEREAYEDGFGKFSRCPFLWLCCALSETLLLTVNYPHRGWTK